MKCLIPDCQNTKIFVRYLCKKHYWQARDRKELNNYPRMKRKDGTGTFQGKYKKLTINGERIFEHRHIVEKALNRKLRPTEKVHHKDENPQNNSLNNLLVTSQSSHITQFHNNKPRIFNWNKFVPENKNNKCQVCNKKLNKQNRYGLCRKHYDTWWHWKQRH